MKSIDSKNIVFVTGCFVSNTCWDDWKTYFESKGYSCIAPPWPHREASAAKLRRQHPDSAIASNRLSEVVDHYADIIRKLPEKPIVIGHSCGGLITQILVNRDLAAAGVAIHSVPPQGVLPYELSFVRSVWQALGLFTSTKKTYLMSFKKWQYAFTNGMSLADQKATYEKYTIPESKMIARDGLTKAAAVDFSKPHSPLLLISGSLDNIMPASLNRRNFRKYKHNGSILEYKDFPGRNHFVLGLPTWKEEADYVLGWVAKLSTPVSEAAATADHAPALRLAAGG